MQCSTKLEGYAFRSVRPRMAQLEGVADTKGIPGYRRYPAGWFVTLPTTRPELNQCPTRGTPVKTLRVLTKGRKIYQSSTSVALPRTKGRRQCPVKGHQFTLLYNVNQRKEAFQLGSFATWPKHEVF